MIEVYVASASTMMQILLIYFWVSVVPKWETQGMISCTPKSNPFSNG